jgi:aerobic carbon-monoxide dehydrogenase medium subunit
MKPAPFRYVRPRSVLEAVELLREYGDRAKVLAGGQSLVPMMSMRLAQPELIIDINRIGSLTALKEHPDGSWHVGALVRHAALERIKAAGPIASLLKRAAGEIGHLPIRLRGSIGGSLVHADPAAEWPVVAMTLEGTLVLESADGIRRVSMSEFVDGPYSTCIRDDELLTGLDLPPPAQGVAAAFTELSRRPGDFATALCAVRLTVEEGIVSSARVVVGGMPGGPIRCLGAEEVMIGRAVEAVGPRAVGESARASCHAYDDIHAPATYRLAMSSVVVEDAVIEALDIVRQGNGAAR